MKIMLTNDDGYISPGICVLAEALCEDHEVVMVAPDSEKSGFSHCMTFDKKLHIIKLLTKYNAYAVDGTPVDCVKLGIDRFGKPDLIISGVNSSENTGTDVHYSGTVHAAIEGAIHGIKSIAVSSKFFENNDYKFAAKFIALNINKLADIISVGQVLNINIGAQNSDECNGVKFCVLANKIYNDTYVGNDSIGYTVLGEPMSNDSRDNTDVHYIEKKYITITPIKLDMTDYESLCRKNDENNYNW